MNAFLLQLELCGIKNIEKPVSFQFGRKTLPRGWDPSDYRVKGIYGENGSGKTAVITGIKILRELIMNPRYLGEERTQVMLHQLINKNTKCFEISAVFLFDNPNRRKEILQYHIRLRQKTWDGDYRIDQEDCLVKTSLQSKGILLYRVRDGILEESICQEQDARVLEQATVNLLSQRAMVSFLFDLISKMKEQSFLVHLLEVFYFALVTRVYMNEEDRHEKFFLSRAMDSVLNIPKSTDMDWRSAMESVKEQIHGSVLEETIARDQFEEYEKRIHRLESFLKIFKPDLKRIWIDRKEDGKIYHCSLNLDYGEYSINEEFESTGIKKLMWLFDGFDAAGSGEIVFIDELDSNINDVYLCKLIEYITTYGKGQLCFTAHNLSPMRVLRESKRSIDFLTSDNRVIPWTKNGNFTPENQYRNGMIEGCPLNVEASDFIGILGRED